MAKKKQKKRAIFDSDSNDESVENGNADEFSKYIEEKSKKIKLKSMKATEDVVELIHKGDEALEGSTSSKSVQEKEQESLSMISNMLASKKNREVDRIYANSVKAQIENELNQVSNDKDTLTFLTNSYKEKKKEYEKVNELIHDEENKNKTNNENDLLNTSHSVALSMLLKKDVPRLNSSPDALESLDSIQKVDVHSSKIVQPKKIFHNDIYRAEDYKDSLVNTVNSPGVVVKQGTEAIDIDIKREAVKEFLKSNLSSYNVSNLLEDYYSRVKR